MSNPNTTTVFGEEISRETVREIITPDNVPVSVRIADIGTRASAVLLDFVFVTVMVLVVIIVSVYTAAMMGVDMRGGTGNLWIAFAVFVNFLIRIVYFPLLEIIWQGQTLGKRLMGIKVIDRNSGPLKIESVLIRNFVREVEFWIPLSVVMSGNAFGSAGANLWGTLFLLTLCLLPFTNRERMRGGDMLAGTWVIKMPQEALLSDLSQARQFFTSRELSHYGIEELQTLDYVLRQEGVNASAMHREVANKIRERIGRKPVHNEDDKEFLSSFYTAQREYLENKQLLEGSAPVNKHSTASSKRLG